MCSASISLLHPPLPLFPSSFFLSSSLLPPLSSPIPRTTLVASQTQVYKLEPRTYDQQVYQCVQGKQFELALQVAVSCMMYVSP